MRKVILSLLLVFFVSMVSGNGLSPAGAEVSVIVDNGDGIFCGDSNCTPDLESCAICPFDCGECPEPPGGGDDGPSGGASAVIDFEFDKEVLEIELIQGQSKRETVEISNTGQLDLEIDLETELIGDFVDFNEESFSLDIGKSREINIDFSSFEDQIPNSYVGKIIGKWRLIERSIDVLIVVKEGLPLFDIVTVLLEDVIVKGDDVSARIDITNLGDIYGVDVDLYYSIIDFDENTIRTGTEKIFIEDKINVVKKLNTIGLSEGNYVFNSRVSYEEISASSSQTFKIVNEKKFNLWWLIILLIILLIYLVYKNKKSKKSKKRKVKK